MEIFIVDPPNAEYIFLKENIFNHIFHLSEQHDTEILCHIAGVSLSGYYKHRQHIILKTTKQEREQEDLLKIQALCKTRKKGYRRVSMDLKKTGNSMNHKKVLRLMKKYQLLAKVRRKNPYRDILKATQEHSIKKNILRRRFKGNTPLIKMGTDITYLRIQGKWCYLSIIKDMVTGEVPSYVLSRSLCMAGTLESIDVLEQRYTKKVCKHMLLHSDQGFHYTHPSYQAKLVNLGITQSMSRKGNCLDNAPTESFFGHMKDEIDITQIQSFEELEKIIDSYIYEYNNSRPQWNKKKMTPVEYRNHLLKNKS